MQIEVKGNKDQVFNYKYLLYYGDVDTVDLPTDQL